MFCSESLYISSIALVCEIYFPRQVAFDQYAGSSCNPIFRQRWSSVKFARRSILIFPIIHISHLIWNSITNGICMSKSEL
jgi:hypothetical protein